MATYFVKHTSGKKTKTNNYCISVDGQVILYSFLYFIYIFIRLYMLINEAFTFTLHVTLNIKLWSIQNRQILSSTLHLMKVREGKVKWNKNEGFFQHNQGWTTRSHMRFFNVKCVIWYFRVFKNNWISIAHATVTV